MLPPINGGLHCGTAAPSSGMSSRSGGAPLLITAKRRQPMPGLDAGHSRSGARAWLSATSGVRSCEGACLDRDHRGTGRHRLSSLLADRVRCGGQRSVVRASLRDEPGTGHVSPLRRRGGRVRRAPHRPRSGIAIGLHHHEANPGQPFRESQTGLDHISFGVADRASLDAWTSWLDELGIEHSGVIDTDKPVPYSVVVFRDPDNIQLELITWPAEGQRAPHPPHGEADADVPPRPGLIPTCECTQMTRMKPSKREVMPPAGWSRLT